MTRTKTLVSYIEKHQLFGSEDFSSKFRTARRTITMPGFSLPDDDDAAEDLPQSLDRSAFREAFDEDKKKRVCMFEMMSIPKAEEYISMGMSTFLSDGERKYIEEQIKREREHSPNEKDEDLQVLVTKIPTVLFQWDIRDLKRLMLADPHVESCLSTLLRGDITYKLGTAKESSLGTRICGVATQARGDEPVRVCG